MLFIATTLLGYISYQQLKMEMFPNAELPMLFVQVTSQIEVTPEYMEQKATIDAVFALALGLYTYVNPVPTVTGAPNLVKLLTQDCKQVTGGLLNVEKDPVKAANAILSHIEANRKKTVFGRLGEPEDLVGLVLFLASNRSSYITGQTIIVDGGQRPT